MKFSAAVARILILGVLMNFAGAAAAQQSYPNKPIHVITPYPPGGSTDPMARLFGQKLTESWGQQVIVDNRPGGNTIIGTAAAAKALPDGYTLILTASSHAILPLLLPTPYDPIKDFAPVATVTKIEFILVCHPSLPANNFRELVALAKSKPGELNYASSATGGTTHLAGELLNIMAGIKMQHIPYKGGGPAITDLIGGQVQMFFAVPISVVSYINSGRLKAIAVTGETRLSALPQVPTFTESGLPGFNVVSWNGVLAPAGTSKEIIDKLSTEIAKILTMPDVKEKLSNQGVEPFGSTPEQFAALLKADVVKWRRIIKIANIKLEQ